MLEWLNALQLQGVRPGLGRIRALLARLGHPERAFPAVVVGGTNGKGSVTRALGGILEAAGYRVGVYTSPHLVRFNERIRVGGEEIQDAELAALLEEVRPHAEAVGASYFEVATVLALVHFARRGVDWAVLEVGMGGRFDATNAVDPVLSVITNVGLDHQRWLGATLAQIAREKAGILRPGRSALTAARGEGLRVLREEAGRVGARLLVLGEAFALEGVALGPEGVAFTLAYEGRHRLRAPVLGAHQAENLALAAVAARRLGVGWAAVRSGLERFMHPGRMEYLPERRLLLDGAHNPDGARALGRALEAHFSGWPRTLVLALSEDKDPRAFAAAFRECFERVVVTRYAAPRAMDPAALHAHFPGAEVVEESAKALERALAVTPPEGLVVVAGSLYLVGEVKRYLAGLEPEVRWQ
ncbi:bifunctional folylpolyglutamate synthase/dihydrofolate synthase [Marinithermus hydrothermalis]|uniref:tetrahydrofolate synthase n=1 Tax=Marinithermus hydrothermalis (strain DSM 14884 / JCM 11576 / T1) TaxID=869210 RepID=F2NNN0_MARHT|nr:folylpolyglutamate synthase/dihydrofolate synthase family protein [Marinithermus hydrothermalis]AEB11045.1 FolC bifunctional protein [Marinithermus hydrothermalis DSM 14884]